MARTKKVRFVSIDEHLRIRRRIQAEADAWRAVYESMHNDIAALEQQVLNMMRTGRLVLRNRANLRNHRDMVLAACGTPSCRTLVYRHWTVVGGVSRRCADCQAELARSISPGMHTSFDFAFCDKH